MMCVMCSGDDGPWLVMFQVDVRQCVHWLWAQEECLPVLVPVVPVDSARREPVKWRVFSILLTSTRRNINNVKGKLQSVSVSGLRSIPSCLQVFLSLCLVSLHGLPCPMCFSATLNVTQSTLVSVDSGLGWALLRYYALLDYQLVWHGCG